jgi:hypothetical protein
MNNILKEIEETLKEYFDNSYSTDAKEVKNEEPALYEYNPQPIHYHTHNNAYLSPFYCGSTPTTIINNYNNKKSKKEENTDNKKYEVTKGEIVLAGAVIAGVSATTVYLMSKDEYVNFYLSKIDEKMEYLSLFKDYDTRNIVLNYQKWKELHRKRTLKICCSKIAGGGSIISSIVGLMFVSNIVLCGGIIGGTASGCYFLWKYLTKNVRKEQQYYDDMMNEIKKMIEEIKKQETSPDPSAPPAYE